MLPEVTAIATHFGVNATRQYSVFKEHQEFSLLKKGANLLRVGAIRVDEEALGAKGIVHEAGDCDCVSGLGGSDLRRGGQPLDFTSGAARLKWMRRITGRAPLGLDSRGGCPYAT